MNVALIAPVIASLGWATLVGGTLVHGALVLRRRKILRSRDLHLARSVAALRERSLEAALAELSPAVALDPTLEPLRDELQAMVADVHRAVAESYEASGKVHDALQAYRHALEVCERDAAARARIQTLSTPAIPPPSPSGSTCRVITFIDSATGREIPIEQPTVIGRDTEYHRYDDGRLSAEAIERGAALNFICIPGDGAISRSHAVTDPGAAVVVDLNSKNGTFLDGHRATGQGLAVADQATISVGARRFLVRLETLSARAHRRNLESRRRALVIVDADPERAERAKRIVALLRDKKGFAVEVATSKASAQAKLDELLTTAHEHGIFVCAAIGPRLSGERVLLGDAVVPFRHLLHSVSFVEGRKVLVLDVDGDPTAFERRFAEEGFEDTLLLTAPGEVSLVDQVVNECCTPVMRLHQDSLQGKAGLRGAFDGAIDGLDGLIAPDSNTIQVRCLEGYEGRLAFAFGPRRKIVDEGVSHSLTIGTWTLTARHRHAS